MTNYLKILFISMLPIVELRGAIPYGVLTMNIPFWNVYFTAVLGNILPVPFLILFAGKALHFCAGLPKVGYLFQKLIDMGHRKINGISTTIWMGLFLFVAIPLPGTGAWTGCLIATLLGMRVRDAFPPIALGVMLSGIIMGIMSYGISGLV